MPMPLTPKLAIKEMVSMSPIVESEEKAPAETRAQSASMDWYDESFPNESCNGKAGQAEEDESKEEHFSMATPRLHIVSMSTPRQPIAAADQGQRAAFVPHWPYSSQWPFCRAPTTLELKGLPRSLTAQGLIVQLNSMGLADRCNFVHVKGSSALINTERHADGREIAGKLHGFSSWEDCKDARPCRVSWCFSKQGFEELMMEQQNSQVWQADGQYTGAWVYDSGSWMPAVHPPTDDGSIWVPMWVPIN